MEYVKNIMKSLGTQTGCAMVAGCGPGYTSFQLGALFDDVVGMDYGGRLIDIAIQMQNNKKAFIGEETITLSTITASLRTDNVTFKQVSE